jgi:plasmid stabilization system protein ParE
MTVHWSETALEHLRAIRDYVARNSPGYAQALADRIVRRTEALATMPLLGAEVAEYEDEPIREVSGTSVSHSLPSQLRAGRDSGRGPWREAPATDSAGVNGKTK